MLLTHWSHDRRTLHLSLHVHDHSGVVLEADEAGAWTSLLPEHRLALLHEAHTHMTSSLVTVILFKRPPMPFSVVMESFLSPVLSAQLMTLIPTLILNLASSWSLSCTSSCPSPRLQLAMLFLPAVGPLFSSAGGSCWCCCELLFVLDCPELCPLHVLTDVFITALSHTCCAITSQRSGAQHS